MFGLGALVLGFASLGYSMQARGKAARARSWPRVEGTVVSVAVKHTGSTGGSGADESRRDWFLPAIEYTYTVRARAFRGNRIVLGEMQPMSHDGALELLKPYREGAVVRVFYDPRNPCDSVLEARVNSFAANLYAWLGAGLIALGCALALLRMS